jgi:hypothetical protein
MQEDLDAHVLHRRRCIAIMDETRNVLVLIADDRTFLLPLGFSERWRDKICMGRTPAKAEPCSL